MTHTEKSVATTPEQLEQSMGNVYAANQKKPDGGPMNTLFGTAELVTVYRALLEHMQDEERWGEKNHEFAPVDFVVAAYEVAYDHTIGSANKSCSHVPEQQSSRMTFGIFVNFWLPRIADAAYGESYADEVRGVIEKTRED